MSGILASRLARSRLLGTGGVAARPVRPTLNIPLGDPGRCPQHPTLVICVYDDSGSMLGGNDSTGLRYQETGLAFEKVARKCRCGNELVAVLHMNRPTSSDLDATPLTRNTITGIASSLAVPADGDGASTMGDTVRRAIAIARAHPNHQASVIAFSDYELTDDLNTLAAQLSAFPGHAHAVVMRSQPPLALVDNNNITVTHVLAGAQPGPVARAIFGALTAHRLGCRVTAATVATSKETRV